VYGISKLLVIAHDYFYPNNIYLSMCQKHIKKYLRGKESTLFFLIQDMTKGN